MLVNNFNRHIHQIWFQKFDSPHPPGVITNDDYNSCRKMYIDFATNNGWSYTLWDETSVDRLIKEHFPSYLDRFNCIDSIIKKVDCARYMILYVYGGLYVDVDSYPKRNLEELLNIKSYVRDDYPYTAWHIAPEYEITHGYDLVVGQEKTVFEYYYNKFGLSVQKLNNAVIFAAPKLRIFLDLIDTGFKRRNNSILNSFGVHTFSMVLYQAMNTFIEDMLGKDNYNEDSRILTLPTVYFYETDVDRDDYEQWGGKPEHKHSPLQFIVHKYMGDWDDNSYAHFLTNELKGEKLDGSNSV